MKKKARATKAQQYAGATVLTEQGLAAVIGGNNGAIVVENVSPGFPLLKGESKDAI